MREPNSERVILDKMSNGLRQFGGVPGRGAERVNAIGKQFRGATHPRDNYRTAAGRRLGDRQAERLEKRRRMGHDVERTIDSNGIS